MNGVSPFHPHLCKYCASPKRKPLRDDAALPHPYFGQFLLYIADTTQYIDLAQPPMLR
jgi:hypothetical protein